MKVTRDNRRLVFTEIGPHPEGFELTDKLTVAINYTPSDENVSPLDKALALDGVILPAIVAALEAAGITDGRKPEPYVYQPEHGAVELILRHDNERPWPAVYITIVSETGDVLANQEHDNQGAAFAAWPSVDWRKGDDEDGRDVLAVGHHRPEENDN